MTEDLLGAQSSQSLIASLERADPGASYAATRAASGELGALTLSERARALARAILVDVDGDRDRLTAVIRWSLADGEFGGWTLWPVGLAASWSAIEADTSGAFDTAMSLMRELTPRMTSEFAIRPLLLHDLDRGLGHLREWTDDPDWNVRRLASEGSRPLLPWGERLPALVRDPAPTLPILDALYADPEESVRRSVANHLNDHSRAHAAAVVAAARSWQERGGTDIERTVRRALRTLVKRGDVDALAVLGFAPASVEVDPLALSVDAVPVGGDVRFRTSVRNTGDQPARLVIDYVLSFPGARGDERSKVFKIAQRSLAPGEATEVAAGHSFRAITTRKYYPGRYGLALQINGVVHERAEFTMEAGS
ncbi:DNA alkylation repair protein [Leucobacter rhizosphaerae]|uniref:DNA alkylation repair protein n=1 Tax=Leucobacter rhizosphaerae TaxID=2932245 RepID=A0ABY4FZW0_9MICO|nr:DNA alkylation repair protein [Leucobacter rhizosphaerae]UOQ61860.1 DNA alkylation repair protein [Leucobacter rhizosphaerae]